MKYKKTTLWLIILFSFLSFCSGQKSSEITIVIPMKPKFDAKNYKYLYITNFPVKKIYNVDKDIYFDPNEEITSRLKNELSNLVDLKIKYLEIKNQNNEIETLIEDKGYWKNLELEEKESSIIFTGLIEFSNKDATGYFPREVTDARTGISRTINVREERLEVSLGIQVYIISAYSGELLYKENFKETSTFPETNKVSLSMFYILFDKLAPKLFNIIAPYNIKGTRFIVKP